MIEGNLLNVLSHVFHLEAILLISNDQLGEEVNGRVSDLPVEGVENVHLHLREHAGIVEAAAHVVELVDLRHPVLLVSVLGGNQQSGTADELVVLLIHHPLGAVPVKQVDCEEECLGEERKGSVSLDEEVDEVWPHKPLDFPLHVNEVGVRQGLVLG